jgi:isopentenyl diphosphate isomerase/L-lactate dehydrogenase-like FMN-dependent dehydrogenase
MTGPDPTRIATIDQILSLARANLDRGSRVWAAAGAGQEVTLTRNTMALNCLALVPRVGRDVSEVAITTTLVGVPLEAPVFLAPVGALALYDPDDARGAAEAATAAGCSAFCSLFATSPWADVAATGPGRHFFQLYALGGRDWIADLVADVEDLGFAGLCITMDSPVIGRRDRSLADGYIWRSPEGGTVNFDDTATSPAHRARFDWAGVEWVCGQTDLPVVVKGVMTPGDALAAVEAGASAVYVSNHGGRMVDHSLSTIEVLGEIVAALPPTIDVVIDSGFTRGAEICKAIALGAKAVGIGRLQCWALAAGGPPMLRRLLEILTDEISRTMANIGCRTLDELEPEAVRWSLPAPPPGAADDRPSGLS